MGQLERYGLYVLCLVIFLILGVAIWGGDSIEPPPVDSSMTLEMLVGGADMGTLGVQPPGPQESFFDSVSSDTRSAAVLAGITLAEASPVPVKDDDESSSRGALVGIKPLAEAGFTIHRVAEGETIGGIAQSRLGSVRYASNIEDLNPGIDPRRMKVGLELRLPTKASLGKKGVTIHRVAKGETIGGIAQSRLGSVRYAQKILDANGIEDARKIRVGTVLIIPDIK